MFIAFAGEEQGLVGALLHAQKADAEGWPIEAVLNNDDYVFGVAAIGPRGHESVVAAYVNPPRDEVEIKVK